MKQCSECRIQKQLFEFHRHPKGKFGRHPKCKKCRNIYHKKYFKRERSKILHRQASQRDYKRWALKRLYGITREDFEAKIAEQGGLCAICKNAKKLCVDHNHSTGQVRSLLCRSCNSGLGAFLENPAILTAAIDYIEKWRRAVVPPHMLAHARFSKPAKLLS